MNINAAFQNAKRIYIDTAPFIYLVEKHTDYFAKVFRIFGLMEATPLQAFTSVITLTEVIVQPLRVGNADLAQEYYDILMSGSKFRLVPTTSEIAISAAAIRARYQLRTPDALHAATAIAMDCDAFLTNDTDFRRVQDLNVLVLDDLEL